MKRTNQVAVALAAGACAAAVLWLAVPASAQTVPGYQVQVYANVTDPITLSFDSGGTLFVGRDAGGSGGGGGDPVKIHKVGPGGSSVIEWGVSAIDDPDSVVVDATGVISGVPGSVLVAGLRYSTVIGEIHAIRPDQSVVLLYTSTQFQNINVMKFDSTNRLVFTSTGFYGNPSGVFVSTGSAPTRLFTVASDPFGLAFDAANNIYVLCRDGKVRVYSAAGSLINDNFATLAASPGYLAFGVGGAFGADLFAIGEPTGNIMRIDADGNTSLFGTGFSIGPEDLAFGPDGALYAGVFGNDAVYRITPCCTAPPCFQGLGDLPGGTIESGPTALSDDGTTVVGYSKSAASGAYYEAFRWRAQTGMVGLGDLPGNYYYSVAMGVSADGAVVTGYSSSAEGTRADSYYFVAFRWTETGGIASLGDLPGGYFCSQAYQCSADGNVVGGEAHVDPYERASIWTASAGWQQIDFSPGMWTYLRAMSPDGTWGAGEIYPGFHTYSFAFRWSAATGTEIIGDLPGGSDDAIAYGISNDGSVVVGRGTSASGPEAFRWSAQTGMVGLGDLAGGAFASRAYAVSPDKGTVVGLATSNVGEEAVMWDVAGHINRVVDVLGTHGVTVPPGWILRSAIDITVNETVVTLCGAGTNPAGNTEAWLARYSLPPPTGACCASDGSCTVTTQAGCTGVWHVEWADCVVAQCPPPTGACCLRDGSCQQLTQAACTQADGLTWTMNAPCTPNPCPYVRGDVNCDHAVNLDDVPYFVAALIGQYTGCDIGLADMNCDGNADGLDIAPFVDCLVNSNFPPCPTGSCCQTNGSCTVTTQADCTGTWTQGGTCSPNPCPEPTGACCWVLTGVCQEDLTEAECYGLNVVWHPGETCPTFDCP